ncbi:MAG TPA: NADH-quinone oxidoreductase subunit NuoB [Verrucomicrobiae bacterium]|nr:NADH-quinone oxidoreductase subunit NuoB [Verrucomicrobiae bacterium]
MWKLFKQSLTTPLATGAYPTTPEPAGKEFRGQPKIDLERCTGCLACAKTCPTGALTGDNLGLELDLAKCIFCGVCQEKCSAGAVGLSQEFELAGKHRADFKQTFCFGEKPVGPDQDMDYLGHCLEKKIKRLFGRSLHIRHLDTGSCNGCDWEINCLLNPVHDIQRFGFDFVASPRHADVLFCTGPVTAHLEQAVKRTYAAVPSPKLVAAVGTCACSGGIYKDGYAVLGGVDKVLPVDIFIPGCPPRPQAIIYGLMVALDKLEQKIARSTFTK